MTQLKTLRSVPGDLDGPVGIRSSVFSVIGM